MASGTRTRRADGTSQRRTSRPPPMLRRLGLLALGKRRCNRGRVLDAPSAQGDHGFGQAPAERRQGIVHAWRDFLVVGPRNDSVRFQLLELLDQHLVTHAAHASFELAIALRAVAQEVQDQRLPLSADHSERGVEAASERGDFCFFLLHPVDLPKGAYLSIGYYLFT